MAAVKNGRPQEDYDMSNISLFFTDSSRSVMSVPCERGVCVYCVKCALFADMERTAVALSAVESCF